MTDELPPVDLIATEGRAETSLLGVRLVVVLGDVALEADALAGAVEKLQELAAVGVVAEKGVALLRLEHDADGGNVIGDALGLQRSLEAGAGRPPLAAHPWVGHGQVAALAVVPAGTEDVDAPLAGLGLGFEKLRVFLVGVSDVVVAAEVERRVGVTVLEADDVALRDL